MRSTKNILICRHCKRLAHMPGGPDPWAPVCCGTPMAPWDECIKLAKGKRITFRKKGEDEEGGDG